MEEQEVTRLKEKMAGLVAKWKGRPETPKFDHEWFQRRGDRSMYIMLNTKLKKLTGGQQKLAPTDMGESEKIARQIGLI